MVSSLVSKFKATVGNNMVWISPLGMPVSQYSYEQKPKNYDKYDCWEMNLTLSKSEIIDNFIGYYPQERDSFQFVISMTDRPWIPVKGKCRSIKKWNSS